MSMIIRRFYSVLSAAEAKTIVSSFPKSDMDAKIQNLLKNNSEIAKKYNLSFTPLTEEERVKEAVEFSKEYQNAKDHSFASFAQKYADVEPLPQKTVKDFVQGF